MINAVCVYPADRGEPAIKTRDGLRERVDGCVLAVDDNGRIQDAEIEDFLNAGDIKVVAHFFDRNEKHIKWYYSMIAGSRGPLNDVATNMVGNSIGDVYGPVVIVKDCAMKHWEQLDKSVSADDVMKTLWYYMKSGVSPEEEYGERTLIRLLSEDVV